jgi:hypothetical protein
MNEQNMQAAQSAADHQSRIGDIVRYTAVAAALVLGAAACESATSVETAGVSATSPHKTTSTVAGETPGAGGFEFAGPVTDGSDAAVGAENDADLYDCGGVKGETYKNADGTDKPYNPDSLISHMNAHPELAKSDSDFWVNIFGEEGLAFLADNGIGNAQHQDTAKVDVADVAPGYPGFIANRNVAALKVDAVAGNFGCKTATGEYKVFAAGPKQLLAGETHLTGTALTKENYVKFVEIEKATGKNLDLVFVQDMNVDTDNDGVADTEIVMVFSKHLMCANNELKIPVQPPVVTTTQNNVPQPTTPQATVTTVPGVTVATNTPKPTPHEPVEGGPATTVETGSTQVNPNPTEAPTTAPPISEVTQPPQNTTPTNVPATGIPNPA